MKKGIQISIPILCHENWDAMTPEAKGRFCSSCNKTVVDFSSLSNSSIANILMDTKSDICGRFLKTQLNCPILLPLKPKWHDNNFWIYAAASMLIFNLSMSKTYAQDAPLLNKKVDTSRSKISFLSEAYLYLSKNKKDTSLINYNTTFLKTPFIPQKIKLVSKKLRLTSCWGTRRTSTIITTPNTFINNLERMALGSPILFGLQEPNFKSINLRILDKATFSELKNFEIKIFENEGLIFAGTKSNKSLLITTDFEYEIYIKAPGFKTFYLKTKGSFFTESNYTPPVFLDPLISNLDTTPLQKKSFTIYDTDNEQTWDIKVKVSDTTAFLEKTNIDASYDIYYNKSFELKIYDKDDILLETRNEQNLEDTIKLKIEEKVTGIIGWTNYTSKILKRAEFIFIDSLTKITIAKCKLQIFNKGKSIFKKANCNRKIYISDVLKPDEYQIKITAPNFEDYIANINLKDFKLGVFQFSAYLKPLPPK